MVNGILFVHKETAVHYQCFKLGQTFAVNMQNGAKPKCLKC